MVGLSDVQINKMMKGVKGFMGVFPIDRLPKKLKHDCSAIVNFEKHNQPGSHWVCFIVKKDWEVVLYLDSYSAPPPDEVLELLCQSGKPIYWGDIQYQPYGSDACGWYCMDVIKHSLTADNPTDVVKRFVNHPSAKNDYIARHLL
jgi:hypothetical protein